MQPGLLIGSAAREFALAGNAKFTLVSKATGARYTYKITRIRSAFRATHFVFLLTGSDNEKDFTYIGAIEDGDFVAGFRRISPDAPGVRALVWAWPRMGQHPELEVWHEGRCGACGRTLTVPESVARGIGPECARKAGTLLQGKLSLVSDSEHSHKRRRVA